MVRYASSQSTTRPPWCERIHLGHSSLFIRSDGMLTWVIILKCFNLLGVLPTTIVTSKKSNSCTWCTALTPGHDVLNKKNEILLSYAGLTHFSNGKRSTLHLRWKARHYFLPVLKCRFWNQCRMAGVVANCQMPEQNSNSHRQRRPHGKETIKWGKYK